jgi:hypothetical protein
MYYINLNRIYFKSCLKNLLKQIQFMTACGTKLIVSDQRARVDNTRLLNFASVWLDIGLIIMKLRRTRHSSK